MLDMEEVPGSVTSDANQALGRLEAKRAEWRDGTDRIRSTKWEPVLASGPWLRDDPGTHEDLRRGQAPLQGKGWIHAPCNASRLREVLVLHLPGVVERVVGGVPQQQGDCPVAAPRHLSLCVVVT